MLLYLIPVDLVIEHSVNSPQGSTIGMANPCPDGGARCSSVVRSFAHGAMGRRIDPSWGEPIELFLVPASAPRQV